MLSNKILPLCRLATSTSLAARVAAGPSSARTQVRHLYSPNDCVQKQGSYEGPGKTTVAILNEDSAGLVNMVDSYAVDGFRLNDNTKILGPCIVFPTHILGWMVEGAHDITEESLALFTILDPKLDVLIIGHGMTKVSRNPVDPRTILKMKQKGVNVEVLTTENAISTYNFLVEEGRVVAAALIPPDFVKLVDTDVIDTKERRGNLLSSKDFNFLGPNRGETILKN
eukprot:GFUD01123659.1.p1 GENE.GFUD01123659.1~~GFUD01123659.1.p1  ORF type:complete len:226 (-),score=62.48 GFUD01123659.1:43-720(-)